MSPPVVSPLRLAKLRPAPTNSNIHTPHAQDPPSSIVQSTESGFSVNIDTPVDASPLILSRRELSPRDDQRFQQAQDSFRQLIHRKSSLTSADIAARTGRRHTVGDVPVLTRRESMRPRSLFDAQDSMRELIRRHSQKRGKNNRRWSLPGEIKPPTRVYVASAVTPGPPRQSVRVASHSSSEKCTIL